MLEKLLRNQSHWGLLILRLIVAIIFIAHGIPKISEYLGGSGIEGTIEGFESKGIFLPTFMAYFVGYGEFLGGVFLLIGLFSREMGVILTAIMLGAVYYVHGSNGFFLSNGGFEYNLALIGMCMCIVFSGGGAVSVDNLLFPNSRWQFIKDPSSIKLDPPTNTLV